MRLWIALGLLWPGILGWSQQSASLDFFADAGGCELDFNKDGLTDGLYKYTEGAIDPSTVSLSLDNTVKFAGNASQRVILAKQFGPGGKFVISKGIDWSASLTPILGEPLRVTLALRAEGFQNAEYRINLVTGSRAIAIQPYTSRDTGGWQVYSMVVPVELNNSGQPNFSLYIDISVGNGLAQGRLWVDEIRVLSNRTVSRPSQLPNGLKLCFNFLYRGGNNFAYFNHPFRCVVGGSNRTAQVLVRHFPDVVYAPYTYFSGALVSRSYRHHADLYNYDDVNTNHPDWFLLDQNGQRIRLDDSYYIDIGRPEVRERAWQSLRDFMGRNGRVRYLHLDNVDMLVGPNRFAPPNYPTNNAWVQAVVKWFEYVGSRLRREFGTTFIPNVAWAPGFWLRGISGYPDAPGAVTLPYIGGFLLEHFTMRAKSDGTYSMPSYGSASGVEGPQAWNRRLLRDSIRLVTENPDKVAILIPTLWVGLPDSPQKTRYAIAMCLIVQHENTYIHLDPRFQKDQHPFGYLPAELFIPLGNPVGNFRIQDGDIIVGGLFVREYQNGIVLANPRSDRDFTFTVPRDLYDWDRNLVRAGTQITIPPRTGMVLWSAPEITVSLSPTNTEVLPGQTVQFTVTYRNTGTAPGTNVRIAVPLPDGMTLVSANPTATVENGQVVWVVPSIPVNGTGTLRFTVRVQ